jgi:excisionase family DNA binding protein
VSSPTAVAASGDAIPFITAQQVAPLVGVSRADTIRKYARDGRLPAKRVGHRYLFDPVEVQRFIDASTAQRAETKHPEPDPEWLAEQLAKFTAEDLRRAASVLARLARDLDANGGR